MSKQEQSSKKKTIDVLKDQLKPLSNEEGDTLAGGFASAGEDGLLDDIEVNGNKCGTTTNSSSCNSVAHCGG